MQRKLSFILFCHKIIVLKMFRELHEIPHLIAIKKIPKADNSKPLPSIPGKLHWFIHINYQKLKLTQR